MSWLSIYGNAINAGMMLTQGDESGCDSSIENCNEAVENVILTDEALINLQITWAA